MQNLKYLIICLVLACELSFAQVVPIPDAAFLNKLLQSNNSNGIATNPTQGSFKIDSNDNGMIEVQEALLVHGLSLSNSNIYNLSGIEYFLNLKHLNVQSNYLSNINLSSNTQLVLLACHQNQLTELDVSNLPDLYYLYAFQNLLTTLNLSSNPQINTISIGYNPNLTSVNIKNNTNQIFPANAQCWINCPNLSCITVDQGEITAMQNFLQNCGITQPISISTAVCNLNTNTFATNDFLVAPNPSDGIFTISFGTTIAKGSVIVYSMLGQKLYERTVANEATTTVQVNELPSGSYIVSVQDENNINNKIIVKK